MGDVYWEPIETIYNNHKNLISPFGYSLMTTRAETYATKIRVAAALFERCVGYVDVTKNQVCKQGGLSIMQQSVYFGQTRFHCLLFFILTITGGLLSFATVS